jgi:hypothetical protein
LAVLADVGDPGGFVLVVVGHEVVVIGGSGAWAVRMGGAESSFRQEKAPLP